jgi:asparagine synthase (glutamine-hydrolysing)
MCGFTGFLDSKPWRDKLMKFELLQQMTDCIASRGPDDFGFWVDDANVGLAHRRLSIIDLSSAGHQPMLSINSRYSIVFNGEIYNHQDLRCELNHFPGFNKTSWRGNSDTETLLACINLWGLEKTLQKSIGMFALALWDRHTKTLFLARDRVGEKPLYYGWQGADSTRSFLFGSDLKALKVHPSFSTQVDRNSLNLFLRYGYIPAPYSIYKGISKLDPGSILSVSVNQPEPVCKKYWDVISIARQGKLTPFTGSPDRAVDQLELLVKNSVRQQMISDVPIGAFLSGGVDSSTIVALMQSQSPRPVKTFTIGFNEKGFNEAAHAKIIAKYLGTEHTEMYISPNQAMDMIPKIPNLYSEPFADSSQIPTYLISQLAKQSVKVSLSGDGGDELFSGYNRYELTAKLWKKLSIMPVSARKLLAKFIASTPPSTFDKLSGIIPGTKGYASLGDKLHKGAKVLASENFHQLYLGLISQISNPSEWVKHADESSTKLIGNLKLFSEFNDVEQMMLLDTLSYLPDDILVKLDRATMGASLEGRVPFLDHRIIEFAWAMPLDFKLRNGQTKWILRELLYRYVPRELIERPKMGFGIPIGDWLRGPLREWAETLLSEDRLIREGYFHPNIIRTKWAEHLSGNKNLQSQLWTVLMFQSWLEDNLS